MSIFNDKALKGVAEAAAKIMAETSHELKGNQHKIDANKNGKIDAHDFKLLRAGKKPEMKKEEVEQLDEVGDTPAGRKALGSYVTKATKNVQDAHADYERGASSPDRHDRKLAKGYLEKANKRVTSIYKAKDRLKDKSPFRFEEVEATEQEQLNEAFPTVADAKKRMDAGKTATGSVTKTATGLVHKRDYKDDDDEDDTPKKKGGYGARQNYKRSTRVNESASFTEMLELYNEHGLKVLAPIEVEEEKIGDQTIEVIDADKVNGVVETIVEEPDNALFTKELKDQEAAAAGKKPQPKISTGKTTGVKVMPEEVEQIDERELTKGEAKKKEDYVMGMKKGLSGFKQRYGDRAKSVMYATATKMAKKD